MSCGLDLCLAECSGLKTGSDLNLAEVLKRSELCFQRSCGFTEHSALMGSRVTCALRGSLISDQSQCVGFGQLIGLING